MANITISVYEALRKIKKYENELAQNICVDTNCKRYTGQELESKSKEEINEIKDECGSTVSSILTKINNLIRFKSAIAKHNSKTEIEIGEDTYTIFEALQTLQFLDNKKNLILNYFKNIEDNKNFINNYNDKLLSSDEYYRYINACCSGLGISKSEADDNTIKKYTDIFYKNNKLDIVYNEKLYNKLEKEISKIENLQTELDFKITQSNIQNEIKIVLED